MIKHKTCCFTNLNKIRISAEITSLCLFNCFYCYRTISNKPNLNVDLLRKNLKKLRKISDDFLITGGEPTLHPNFKTIYNLLVKERFNIAISTTGLNIEKYVDLLKYDKLRSINLSLDSYDKNVNDRIRGKGAYKTFINSIKYIAEVKRYNPKLRVKVQIVLTPMNRETLTDTVKFLSGIKIVDLIIISSQFPYKYKVPNIEEKLNNVTNKDIVLQNINYKTKYNDKGLCGSLIHITPDGNLYDCPLNKRKIGFIDDPLEKIIKNLKKVNNMVKECPAIKRKEITMNI